MLRCDGRTALVTGAASGIGEAIVIALAEAGARVAVSDINLQGALAVAGRIDGMALALDVTDRTQVQAAVAACEDRLGPVDILVNAAGGNVPRSVVESDDEAYITRILGMNLYGVIRCTMAVLPGMMVRRHGRIVNISSGAGAHGSVGQGIYSAAKGGVNAFTKTVALEAAPHGVTCNAVLPGTTETPPMREFLKTGPEAVAFVERKRARIPVGRLGQPEDTAGAVVYFAADSSSFVTGQLLDVNGAMSL